MIERGLAVVLERRTVRDQWKGELNGKEVRLMGVPLSGLIATGQGVVRLSRLLMSRLEMQFVVA